jgi:hypothetical protein
MVGVLILRIGGIISSHAGTNKQLALENGFHGGQQFPCGVRLNDIAPRARAQSFFYDVPRAIFAYKQNLGLRGQLSDTACGLDSIQRRKANIEQDEIGLQFSGFLHRLQAVRCFSDNSQVRLFLKDRTDKTTPRLEIIDYEDLDY